MWKIARESELFPMNTFMSVFAEFRGEARGDCFH